MDVTSLQSTIHGPLTVIGNVMCGPISAPSFTAGGPAGFNEPAASLFRGDVMVLDGKTLTVEGQITSQAMVQATDFSTPSVISQNMHQHTAQGPTGTTTKPIGPTGTTTKPIK